MFREIYKYVKGIVYPRAQVDTQSSLRYLREEMLRDEVLHGPYVLAPGYPASRSLRYMREEFMRDEEGRAM